VKEEGGDGDRVEGGCDPVGGREKRISGLEEKGVGRGWGKRARAETKLKGDEADTKGEWGGGHGEGKTEAREESVLWRGSCKDRRLKMGRAS